MKESENQKEFFRFILNFVGKAETWVKIIIVFTLIILILFAGFSLVFLQEERLIVFKITIGVIAIVTVLTYCISSLEAYFKDKVRKELTNLKSKIEKSESEKYKASERIKILQEQIYNTNSEVNKKILNIKNNLSSLNENTDNSIDSIAKKYIEAQLIIIQTIPNCSDEQLSDDADRICS